jgi:hypothetical protein
MKSTEIRVERFNVVSKKSFEETLAGLYAGIGRPAMSSLVRILGCQVNVTDCRSRRTQNADQKDT